ncbi:mutator type transposase [Tanacetum coccineum]
MSPISSFSTVEESVDEHEIADEYLTDGYLTEKEQQQLLLDEETLREILEEQARTEKECEERMRVNYTVGPQTPLRLPVQSLILKIGRNGPRSGHFGACLVPKDEWPLIRFVSDGPLTSLDERLYALACEEDVRCLATLVKSFKLIEVYIEHGVTALDSYLRAPRHESSDTTKEPVYDSVTPSSLPQHDSSTPCKDYVCFADVAGSGVDSSRLIETQSELLVSEEPDVGRTQEPILAEVSTQEPIVTEVSTQEPIMAEVSTQVPIVEEVGTHEFTPSDRQFLFDDEVKDTAYETEYDVQSSKDDDDDDDDVDEDFLVDEENEIVERDVDVHLFGISVDLPFDNIGVTNLASNDVLEGEDVDVINADSFDSDPGNDEETNYRKRRLAKLRTEMEGVINASGQWKYSFYIGQKFTTLKEAKDRVYLHSIESRRNLKLYKNDSVRIRARCDRKVPVFTIRDSLGLDGAFMKGPFLGQILVAVGHDSNNGIYPLAFVLVEAESKSSWCWFLQCLGDDIDLHPNSNFTFISDRQKSIILAIKTMYPSAEHRYCLRHIHENIKQGWCGQAYKDLLWRAASATNVRDFESRAKSDLLLNNICEVFNSKIAEGRDKLMITLLEYIKEYCMKIIVNVQDVIDKSTSPLTPNATRIMEFIKKEAHLMKELRGILCKHVVAACWNMAMNDRETPPLETWVNPCYWLSTWNKTYSHKIQPIYGTKYWETSTCPTTLLPSSIMSSCPDGSGGSVLVQFYGYVAAELVKVDPRGGRCCQSRCDIC